MGGRNWLEKMAESTIPSGVEMASGSYLELGAELGLCTYPLSSHGVSKEVHAFWQASSAKNDP